MTSFVFSDKANHDNLSKYFQLWLDVTNSDPSNKRTLARAAWCMYEAAMINGVHDQEKPLESAYKFSGDECATKVELNSMFNALLVFGPLSEDSDYAVCRCGRVVLKTQHYTLRNPNADCCSFCVNLYDEDQFSANKLFEMPTSCQTWDAIDLESIPACPITNDPTDWGSSLRINIPSDEEKPIEVQSCFPEAKTKSQTGKRAYVARRRCVVCGGPNKNRKRQRCSLCLSVKSE